MFRNPLVQFVFIALAFLCAFTLPPAKSSAREMVQAVFLPVSSPARAVARWATERVSPPREADALSPDKSRGVDEVLRQNAVLLTRLVRLEAEVDQLKHVAADRAGLGADLQKYVRPAAVVGGSVTSGRQTIVVNTSGIEGLRDGQAVIRSNGFVGAISGIAPGGVTGRVLLATDPTSKLSARFVRLVRDADGVSVKRVDLAKQPLVEGTGTALAARQLPADDVREAVAVGDVAILDDPAWPAALQGLRLGSVRRIELPPTGVGYATVELEPVADLGALRDVLIVVR